MRLMAVVVKFGCWLWGRSIKNSGVAALTQDAMNDVIFKFVPSHVVYTDIQHFLAHISINWVYISFSPETDYLSQFAKIWWLDSVGAIVISLYIILEWIQTFFRFVQPNLTIVHI